MANPQPVRRDDAEEADEFKCRGGRPPKYVDADQLRKLRAAHWTLAECAAFFNISTRRLSDRLKVEPWKGAWEDAELEGKGGLRLVMWTAANNKFVSGPQRGCYTPAAVSMQQHLSKHWLGMTDKAALELTGKDGGPIEVSTARERVHAKLDNIAERIQSRVDKLIDRAQNPTDEDVQRLQNTEAAK